VLSSSGIPASFTRLDQLGERDIVTPPA
jgi:hypothetical protein